MGLLVGWYTVFYAGDIVLSRSVAMTSSDMLKVQLHALMAATWSYTDPGCPPSMCRPETSASVSQYFGYGLEHASLSDGCYLHVNNTF